MTRPKTLDHQIVVRVSADLYQSLAEDASEHGRTMAQSARFLLTRALRERPQ